MMCINLGGVPDWITAIASTVGLGFVFWQLLGLNQQTKLQIQQMKLQTYSDYTRRYEAIVTRLPEDVNSDSFVLIGRCDYDPTMRAMRSYFDLCFEEWDLRKKELIDDTFWSTWKGGIKTAMSKPAFKQAWEITKSSSGFGNDFATFLETLSDGNDLPNK